MTAFPYGQTEIDHLSKRDKKLAAAIARIGKIERAVDSDVFRSLIFSVVSQQISNKAAETVSGRLQALLGEVTSEAIQFAALEDIQKCGMSVRKAGYIKGIGEAAKTLDFMVLDTMTDNEIIKTLSALNGIGVWTAEMLLIFSLCRPDVLSWGDLAIRRGICNLYGHKMLTREQFEKYRRRYSPYGSVASLYLWELSHEGSL